MTLLEKIESLDLKYHQPLYDFYSRNKGKFDMQIRGTTEFASLIEQHFSGDILKLDPEFSKNRPIINNFMLEFIQKLENRLETLARPVEDFVLKGRLENFIQNLKEMHNHFEIFKDIKNCIQFELKLIQTAEVAEIEAEKAKIKEAIDKTYRTKESLQENGLLIGQFELDLKDAMDKVENLLQHIYKQKIIPLKYQQQRLTNQGILRLDPNGLANVQNWIDIVIQATLQAKKMAKEVMELSTITKANEKQDECPICFHRIGSSWAMLKCCHSFCTNCIKRVCPTETQTFDCALCRTKMTYMDICIVNGEHRSNYSQDTFKKRLDLILKKALNYAFMVVEQPQQIITKGNWLQKLPTVALLVQPHYFEGYPRNLRLEPNEFKVKPCIIREEEFKRILGTSSSEYLNPPLDRKCVLSLEVCDNKQKKQIEGFDTILVKENCHRYVAKFNKLRLKDGSRKANRKVDSDGVAEEKHSMVFETSVVLSDELFKLRTLSHPIFFVSHGSQEHYSEATAIWDNAFGSPGRTSLDTSDFVSWSELAPEISNVFARITGRGLTKSHLHFLKQCFFKKDVPNSEHIGRKGFTKNINMPKQIKVMKKGKLENEDCGVFKWTFELMQLLKRDDGKLSLIWRSGLIDGMIERTQAESLLQTQPIGTFLIRFCESRLKSLSITVKNDVKSVFSLIPYDDKDALRSFANIIRDVEGLKFFWKGGKTKDEVFGPFYVADVKSGDDYKNFISSIPTTTSPRSPVESEEKCFPLFPSTPSTMSPMSPQSSFGAENSYELNIPATPLFSQSQTNVPLIFVGHNTAVQSQSSNFNFFPASPYTITDNTISDMADNILQSNTFDTTSSPSCAENHPQPIPTFEDSFANFAPFQNYQH